MVWLRSSQASAIRSRLVVCARRRSATNPSTVHTFFIPYTLHIDCGLVADSCPCCVDLYLHIERLTVLDSARVTRARCGVGKPRVAPPWRASGAKGSVKVRPRFVETVSRMSECGTVERRDEHTRATLKPLASSVAHARGHCSTSSACSNPACWRPVASPPHPAYISTTLGRVLPIYPPCDA